MNRIGFLGGSDVPVILGLSPYKSPLRLYAEKLGHDFGDDADARPYLRDGQDLEPLIVQRLAERFPALKIRRARTFVHPEHDYLRGTVDRIGLDDGSRIVIEIKTTSPSRFGRWLDATPLDYQAQVQFYLACSGYTRARIACWCYGRELVVRDLAANPRFQRAMIQRCREFWQLVQDRREPDAIGLSDEIATLDRLHPDASGVVALPQRALAIANDWQRAKEEATAARNRAKSQEAILRQLLGDHDRGRLPDGSVLSITQTRSVPSYRLAGVWPDGSEAYTKHASKARILKRQR